MGLIGLHGVAAGLVLEACQGHNDNDNDKPIPNKVGYRAPQSQMVGQGQ